MYEAIHLAVLSGLPTQVGRKDDMGVFRGTRERRFQVFPGSALAKKPPNWLLAAQILDIGGKVWAMQCARVEPAWIERQAAHLVRTSCSDVHWSRKRSAVVAFEQVSLFGLVLVERRAVTFRTQDPALAHAVFLREALARCDIDARADFVRANGRVLDEARDIEARQRRQGLLKDEDALAAFFAGKLPADICSSRALDAWYRKAPPAEQAALRWSLADVTCGEPGLDSGAFPAALELGGQRYRLEYRFVPGDPADGVTLQLPLALLNALPERACEWLVPGLQADKAAELIRGLPKALRRNFVPAPDFARAFVEAEAAENRDQSALSRAKVHSDPGFRPALARFLTRTTGVAIGAEAFAGIELPPHLRMRFSLRDPQGGELAASRDLAELRAQWRGQAREAFARKTDVDLTRENVQAWDFETIPPRIAAAGKPDAFPALVDLGASVALQVFERNDEARAAHARGVERLLRNALAGDIRRAHRQLPISRTLALKHAPLGTLEGLREDLVDGGLSDLLHQYDLQPRSREDFEALLGALARKLFPAAVERLKLAEPIIELRAELTPWLRPPRPGQSPASYADLREQLDDLLAPGFLRQVPAARLAHFPRYIKGMQLRAERLRRDPGKDLQRLQQVLPYWRAYLRQRGGDVVPAALERLRWLVEEYRVSLFAQELKTAEPVSPKRLQAAVAALGSGTGR